MGQGDIIKYLVKQDQQWNRKDITILELTRELNLNASTLNKQVNQLFRGGFVVLEVDNRTKLIGISKGVQDE